MDVSIVIVCWNSASCISQCLASLDIAGDRYTAEVILVDNGSQDDTVALVRNQFPRVKVIETGSNLGFARATNLGSHHANGRYLFLLNPDAEVAAGSLDSLVDFMDAHPDAGAASPKILNEDGTPALFAIREFPSVRATIIRQFGLRKLFPRHHYFGQETLATREGTSVSPVPCVIGAAIMVRRALFEHLGGLNEELPMYFEDLDLCARIGLRQPIYQVATAQVTHIGRKSADGASARSLLLAMENGEAPWLYLRRYHGVWHARAFATITLLGSLFRVAALGAFLPFALVLGRGLASWTRVRIKRSLALVEWCLSSRKHFYSRIASFFDLPTSGTVETTA
jgi:GT2 family glycosyltransferase